jgi:hypothetical protein
MNIIARLEFVELVKRLVMAQLSDDDLKLKMIDAVGALNQTEYRERNEPVIPRNGHYYYQIEHGALMNTAVIVHALKENCGDGIYLYRSIGNAWSAQIEVTEELLRKYTFVEVPFFILAGLK